MGLAEGRREFQLLTTQHCRRTYTSWMRFTYLSSTKKICCVLSHALTHCVS